MDGSDLLKNNVTVEAKPEEKQSMLMSIFISWFPMILLIGVWIFFMKQMQGGGKGGGPFSFGKSKARQLDQTTNKTTLLMSLDAMKPKKKSPSWWIS